jgi:N-acetylmuramoyl-L-alanine amidase
LTQHEVDPADEQLKKDTSYSPASERETQALQNQPTADDPAGSTDARIAIRPGTGGPDDPGDIEIDEAQLNLDGSVDKSPDSSKAPDRPRD